MALILREGVAESMGELVELKTGVVLDPMDAYETVQWQGDSEPLGTRVPVKLREPLRAQSRFPVLRPRELPSRRARLQRASTSF